MQTCPKCGEQIEDGFDSCWKCAGAAQSEATEPATAKKPLQQLELICMFIAMLPSVVFFGLGRSRDARESAVRIAVIVGGWVVGFGGLLAVKIYQCGKSKGGK
jgi:uncharacterized membrane protein YvbJ